MAGSKPTPEEQLNLAMRLVDDDESVLVEILRQLGPFAKSVLRRAYCTEGRGLRPHDIEDILAISLHRLWEKRQQYNKDTSSLWTWFITIANNVTKDILKSAYHRARKLEAPDGQDVVERVSAPKAAPSDGPADRKDAKKTEKERKDVKEILDAMPEKYKTILISDAATRDGKASSAHLSDLLDIPVNQVPMNRKRALERMRTELRKRGHVVP
jgi:RNA polymerase sigma factor (sigma-70 family)